MRICSGKTDPTVHYSHGLSLYNEIVKTAPAGKTYLEIFDGGHNQNVDDQFRWILTQVEKAELVEVTG